MGAELKERQHHSTHEGGREAEAERGGAATVRGGDDDARAATTLHAHAAVMTQR